MKTKTWWLWISCAGAPLAAFAQAVTLSPTKLELPATIGPLVFDGEPHHFEDPRLGSAWQYNGQRQSLTVYLYDLGEKAVPDGPDSVQTCQQFEEAEVGVIQAKYPDTVLKKEQLVRLSKGEQPLLAREAVFEFKIDGRPALSYVWITGTSSRFMKMRYSADASLGHQIAETRRAILDAFGESIARVPPVPVATPATEPAKKHSMVVYGMDASQEETSLGLMYLGTLGAVTDKLPESQPMCGGPVTPTYEAELATYRTVQAMGLVAEGEIGKKLQAIENAGFLEEFVWVDRHQESWGNKAPEGLEVSAYKKWRKKNLKNFKIRDFGRLENNGVRPLPVEPPNAY